MTGPPYPWVPLLYEAEAPDPGPAPTPAITTLAIVVEDYLIAQLALMGEMDAKVEAGGPNAPTVSPEDSLRLEGYRMALHDLRTHLVGKTLV